ncbi:MAG: hypothetical protein EOO05_08260 [Chitinophagaceae bacterium]|nr:MAG: hypothetical protein EOO05_08260 [Chitinophagaceae bacterium]
MSHHRFFRAAAIVALLLTTVSAWSQKTFTDAVDMNNYLIAPNDSLYQKGQALGRSVGVAYSTKDYSGIAPAKKAIIKYASDKLVELKKVKDQFGSEEFRQGIIDFLEYEVNIMKNKTPLLDKLNSNTTEAEFRAAIDEMMAESRDEAKFLQKVTDMQARFAKKNGFAVEAPVTQE